MKRLCSTALPMLLAWLAAGTAPVAAAPTAWACSDGASASCQQARDALAQARQQVQDQQARIDALDDWQRRLDALAAHLRGIDADIRSASTALGDTAARTAQARASLASAGTACAATLASATARLDAAAAYRDSASAFARAPTARASRAAAAADQARDALAAREAASQEAVPRCTARMTALAPALNAQESAESRLRQALDAARRAGSGVPALTRTVATTRPTLATASQADTGRLLQSADAFGAAAQAWAAGLARDLGNTGAAIEHALGPDPGADPAALLAAARGHQIAEDARVFRQLTADALRSRCAAAPACLARLRHEAAQRDAAAEQAALAWAEAAAGARRALAALEAAGTTAQAAVATLDQAKAAAAAAPAMPVLAAERARVDAAVQAQREPLVARLAELRAAESRAQLLAYGPASAPVAAPPAAIAYAPAPPVSMTAAPEPGPIATRHAHQFIAPDVAEARAYAAYTYVVLAYRDSSVNAALADAFRKTLSNIVRTSTAEAQASAQGNTREYNLFCVPNTRARMRNAAKDSADAPLLDEYDHDHIESLLLRAHSGLLPHQLRKGRIGFGPYLLTTLGTPIAETRAGSPLLFVDLSGIPARYLPDLIDGYKQRFNETPPAGGTTEWKPSLLQAVVIRADNLDHAMQQIKSAAGWEVAKGLGVDPSKQSFVRISP